MHPPFVVFSLPRSRSAWLAWWLSRVASGAPIGHDTAIEAASVDDWLETVFRRVRGTCETGAVEAWPILRRAVPDCRIAVVLRPVQAVADSLAAAGAPADCEALWRRSEALVALARQPGVLTLPYEALSDPRACCDLQEHCLDIPFDWPAWKASAGQIVTIDMAARLARLDERRAEIEALKAETAARVGAPQPFATVGEEQWIDVADACEALGAVHHTEATEGQEGPFRLDRDLLVRMAAAGLWRVFIARVDGTIVGYCCWTRETNAEAAAPPTMLHGPFYVAPDAAGFRFGVRLLAASRDQFAREGYRVLKLHHTVYGRGNRAGALYQSLGAAEFQREYIWRIGGHTP